MKKEKLSIGTKVKITGNSNLHGFEIGDVVGVVNDVTETADKPGYNLYNCKAKNDLSYSIRDYDIEVVKEESLLEQAKRLYPIGTKYKCAKDGKEGVSIVELFEDADKNVCSKFRGYIHNQYVYADGKWAEIIKEETKTTNMITTQTVTRAQLKTLHSKVCSKWQSRIEETIKSNIFADSYEVSNELLKEAFKEADTAQTAALLKVFTKPGNGYVTLATGDNFEADVFETRDIAIGKDAVPVEFRGKSIIFDSSSYEVIIMPNQKGSDLDTMIVFKEK